jgi:predicted RNase H-related nuclease YkuK (DUF458 family)
MNATIEQIQDAIKTSSPSTKVYVGCDSKIVMRGKKARFATVVILHIDGKHGGKLFSIVEEEPIYGSVRTPKMRLLTEAYKAIDVAAKVAEVVGDRHFEVHLDFNLSDQHKSNAAVKEATAYVLGTLGLQPKFKPHAFAASTAADKLVH